MNARPVNEYQSLRVMSSLARFYRATSPRLLPISRDIEHVVAAYELHDRDVAIACNRYIITKYPALCKVAACYGLRPMNEVEICMRTEAELQHMLYSLCVFLYDGLRGKKVKSCAGKCK